MTSPIDDLIENGPWPFGALCLDCGVLYPATALTRAGMERLKEKPIPYGTCAACIAKDDAALAELTKRDPKEEVLPNIKDVRKQYETDHADPSDPFDGRSDLF